MKKLERSIFSLSSANICLESNIDFEVKLIFTFKAVVVREDFDISSKIEIVKGEREKVSEEKSHSQ